MKKFLFLVMFVGTGFAAQASSDVHCMTTNQRYCQDCDPQTKCRMTMDIERITNRDGRNYVETIAYGICDEDVNAILNGESCK